MTFEELYRIEDELEQISKTYDIFTEETRLTRSKAARVEFLTTVKYIEQYLKPGARILDIGAGTGRYSFYFAEKGYQVDSLELADNNVRVFREKLAAVPLPITLRQGNAADLSAYPDETFDIVLLMGPLYHLHRDEDRQKCIAEAKRVCKPDGKIFFAFISNDMVIMTEFCYNNEYFKTDDYDHDTFKVRDFPFVFFTVDQCREMLERGGVTIEKKIAADGLSEMLEDKISGMDDESYRQYLRYHFYCCEKPELLGYSNHLLFIGTK